MDHNVLEPLIQIWNCLKDSLFQQFKQAITKADGFSIVAIVVAILIHTLILFNYIMAYRTRTIRVGKDTEEDGGRILY